MSKVRLDTLMVQRNVAADTDEALRLVLARSVKVGDEYATHASMMVEPDAAVSVKGAQRFASRGGDKLQGALDAFALTVHGKRCIDIGCSTGGFSDCLLQAGAASVACVDVGYGQLAWKVRNDERTAVFERTNIRTADPASLGAPFDVLVADLSFIGLAQLAPTFARYCTVGSVLLALVKPQFESNPGEAAGGFVNDPAVRARTVEEVAQALQTVGFVVKSSCESPIVGKKRGNVEFFVYAVFGGDLSKPQG